MNYTQREVMQALRTYRELWAPGDDCERVCRVARQSGIELSHADAAAIWDWYATIVYGGRWLMSQVVSDHEILRAIELFITDHTSCDTVEVSRTKQHQQVAEHVPAGAPSVGSGNPVPHSIPCVRKAAT